MVTINLAVEDVLLLLTLHYVRRSCAGFHSFFIRSKDRSIVRLVTINSLELTCRFVGRVIIGREVGRSYRYVNDYMQMQIGTLE